MSVQDGADGSHWLVLWPLAFGVAGGVLAQKATGEAAVTPYVGERLHLHAGIAGIAWLLTLAAVLALVLVGRAWSAGSFSRALVAALCSLVALGALLIGAGDMYQQGSRCTIRACLDSQPYPATAQDATLAVLFLILATTVMVIATLPLLQRAVMPRVDRVVARRGNQANRS